MNPFEHAEYPMQPPRAERRRIQDVPTHYWVMSYEASLEPGSRPVGIHTEQSAVAVLMDLDFVDHHPVKFHIVIQGRVRVGWRTLTREDVAALAELETAPGVDAEEQP